MSLYFFDYFYAYGGGQKSTVVLLNDLHHKSDLDVCFLSVDLTNDQLLSDLESEKIHLKSSNGIKFQGAINLRYIAKLIKVCQEISDHVDKKDVWVLTNSKKVLFTLWLSKLIFRADFKIVFYNRVELNEGNTGLLFRYLLNNHVQKIMSVSQNSKLKLECFIKDRGKSYLTYTSVDGSMLRLRSEAKPEVFFNDNKSFSVLYAGSVIRNKGLHILIKAFSSLPSNEATLYIAGSHATDATNEYFSECEKLASDLNVCIVWLGWVANIAPLIRRASLVCLPSLTEGLPRIVQESMYLGTPVVSSNVGGVPELIENKVSGFIYDPLDVSALADILLDVFVNGVPQKVTDAAKLHVEHNFNNNTTMNRFLNNLRG